MDRKPINQPQTWPISSPDPDAAVCLVFPGQCPDHTNPKPVWTDSRIHMPHRGQPHDEPMPAPEPPVASSRRPGILVVDDDVGVRALLNDVLWQQGFMVWLAGNGLQALELYQELRTVIDLVLLDIQMPHLDGPQTLTAMQQLHPGICCCFMTADSGSYSEKDLFDRGAVHIFQKPFRLHDIAQTLWNMVHEPVGRQDQGKCGDTLPELFLG
jgi:two-component system response regulator (stage 0 sporulation protein F)